MSDIVKRNFTTKLEILTNVATTVAALLLCAVLVKVYFVTPSLSGTPRPQSRPNQAAVGTNLKGRISGVDLTKTNHTLVLAISTHCHFCTESAPFFRTLRGQLGQELVIVAVLPETTGEAKEYLDREGVQVDHIAQATLPTIGVVGTPTMLLLSDKGVVTKYLDGSARAGGTADGAQCTTARSSFEAGGRS